MLLLPNSFNSSITKVSNLLGFGDYSQVRTAVIYFAFICPGPPSRIVMTCLRADAGG